MTTARGNLAIVAPKFGVLSETFVSDHVRSLLPGRTLLISLEENEPNFNSYESLILQRDSHRSISKFFTRRVMRRLGFHLDLVDQRRLVSFLKERNVRWLLAEFGHMGLIVSRAAVQTGIPLFVYFRGYDASALLRFSLVRRQLRIMFEVVSGVFCVSAHLRDKIAELGCPKDKIFVVPSGADPEVFKASTKVPGRIIFVGRLVEKKSPITVINAFSRVARNFSEAHLEIIGDGPLRMQCEEAVASFGLEDRVRFLGSVPHRFVADAMARASIFVQHSVTATDGNKEGLPATIIEAMCAELPVIATYHSGIPEAVIDGLTGILVAEGDSDALVCALSALLADPDVAIRLGRAGRFHAVSRFSKTNLHHEVIRVMGLE